MTRLSDFNQPWKSMEVATVPCISAWSKCMQILEENWSASYVKALIVHEDLCLVNRCLSCMNYFTAGCRRSMPGRNSSVQEGLKVICCSATIQPFMTDRMSVWTQHSSILTGLHDCPGYGIAACCIVANFMQYWWSLMRPVEPGAIGQPWYWQWKKAIFGIDRKGPKLHTVHGYTSCRVETFERQPGRVKNFWQGNSSYMTWVNKKPIDQKEENSPWII